MSFYAQFDSTLSPPQPVIGWYDTDAINYSNLPPLINLLELNQEDWDNRLKDPSGWAVDGGVLVPYTPPQPDFNLEQQAANAISTGGLSIAMNGSINFDFTLFPTDSTTQAKLTAVITTINSTGAFPGNVSTYPMKDSFGSWHSFTIPQYMAVAGAIANYVSNLYLIIDGNPFGVTQLPSNSITLSV